MNGRDRRRLIPAVVGGGGIAQRIAAWQDAQTTLVHAGGLPESLWGSDSAWNLDVTFIDPGYAFCQDGLVRQITLWITPVTTEINTAIFKVFRLSSGTTYDFVTEQSFSVPVGAAVPTKLTVTLSPPIAVQMGDVPGFRIYHNPALAVINAKSLPAWAPQTRYVAGNITSQTNFTSANAGHIGLECFMYAPYAGVTGDSIPEGHNGAANWHSGLHNNGGAVIPGGDPTSEIANQLREIIGNGSLLQYQNQALGSQGFDWVRTTGAPACVAIAPHSILVHAGINDVLSAVAWADVESDLDAIKALLVAGETLLIDEILPCTNADDTEAAAIRTYNANLAVWCAANGATLILCWAAFGQLRAATSQNDDLLTAYSQDGTHLSTAGVAALAEIWKRYL